MWQLPELDQGCYSAVSGCVFTTLQQSSGSAVTVLSGSKTVGAPGQKKGESYNQGIRGSLGSLCLSRNEMIMSLEYAAWRLGGFSKA